MMLKDLVLAPNDMMLKDLVLVFLLLGSAAYALKMQLPSQDLSRIHFSHIAATESLRHVERKGQSIESIKSGPLGQSTYTLRTSMPMLKSIAHAPTRSDRFRISAGKDTNKSNDDSSEDKETYPVMKHQSASRHRGLRFRVILTFAQANYGEKEVLLPPQDVLLDSVQRDLDWFGDTSFDVIYTASDVASWAKTSYFLLPKAVEDGTSVGPPHQKVVMDPRLLPPKNFWSAYLRLTDLYSKNSPLARDEDEVGSKSPGAQDPLRHSRKERGTEFVGRMQSILARILGLEVLDARLFKQLRKPLSPESTKNLNAANHERKILIVTTSLAIDMLIERLLTFSGWSKAEIGKLVKLRHATKPSAKNANYLAPIEFTIDGIDRLPLQDTKLAFGSLETPLSVRLTKMH